MKRQDENHSPLTIGRTARLAEVGIPTMRFYERAGLLPKASRTAANYRLYSDETVSRIRFIRRAQTLGFTLSEIKDLLELRVSRETSCAQVRARAEAKIADIAARLRSLRQMSRALVTLARECESQSGSNCPLLRYLENGFA
jgi:MerR family transcriptional regulator, copper efflux regulator